MSDFRINPPTTSTGGGTPGGNNTDLQYNNAGAFGGFADGTSTQVLHGGRTFSQIVNADIAAATIDLTAKVTGLLPPANAGVANCATSGQGYFVGPGFTFPPSAISAAAVLNGATANQVKAVQFVLPFRIVVSNITVGITTLSAGTTVTVGIYDAAGTTKLIDSGTFSGASTGIKRNAITPVTLTPGVYWFAWSASDTTVASNVLSTSGYYAVTSGILGASATVARGGLSSNTVSAGVLPSSLGTISANGSINVLAAIFET